MIHGFLGRERLLPKHFAAHVVMAFLKSSHWSVESARASYRLETSHLYCSLVEGSARREMSGWWCWGERGAFSFRHMFAHLRRRSVFPSWATRNTRHCVTHRSHRREMIMSSMAFFVKPSLLYHVQWWIHLRGNQESAMHRYVLRQGDRRRSPLSLVFLSTNVVPKTSGQFVRASRERERER